MQTGEASFLCDVVFVRVSTVHIVSRKAPNRIFLEKNCINTSQLLLQCDGCVQKKRREKMIDMKHTFMCYLNNI